MSSVRTHRKRSERLLAAVQAYARLLVVTHDNPDPDAIAAGWAVQRLLRERLRKPVRLVGGGEIVRAESRYMVRLLEIPLELLTSVPLDEGTGLVLVDWSARGGHPLAQEAAGRIAAVIDRHPARERRPNVPFQDIRDNVAATTTIAAGYLREQQLEPGEDLATALLFALRTETRACETEFSRVDRGALLWLTRRADPSRLAEIENAPLSRAYYSDLVLALQKTFLYEDTALCLLPRAEGPEIIGEVADLLIRCREIHRVLCGAVWRDGLLISLRTCGAAENAADLLQATLQGLGRGGGHEHRAGGKIVLGDGAKITDELESELRTRWLTACGVHRQRGTRLVPRYEILEHL